MRIALPTALFEACNEWYSRELQTADLEFVLVQRKRVMKQFIWVSIGRAAAAVLQAVVLALVARAVTPAEFGLLGVFLGFATVAQTVIDMGVATFIIRERASKPESGDIALAMRFNWFTSILLSVLTAAAIAITAFVATYEWLFLLPLAVWIGAERNADARISIALADGDAKINVINLVGRRLLATGILVALVSLGTDGLLAYSSALAVAAVVSSIFANGYVRKRVSPRSGSSYRELLRRSRPYWIHSVATQSRNLDSALVGAAAGATAAGYYTAGSRLTNPLRILPYSLANVLLPEASRAYTQGRSLRSAYLMAGGMGAVLAVVYLALIPLMPWLIPIVLGADYVGAIVVIQIVLVGFPFAAGVSLVHALLQAMGRKSVVATSSTIFAALTLASVWFAALEWGAVGAAVAMSITTFLQFLYLLIWLVIVTLRRRRGQLLGGEELEPNIDV